MGARDKFIVIAVVAFLGAVTAYSVGSVPEQVEERPAFGGTLTEAVVGGPRVLNPHFAQTSVDRDVAALVFNGLTRYDQRGAVVPDLAAEFHVEEDGKAWVFTLRPEARWHDGMPVTSRDVVFTVAMTQDPAYRGGYGSAFEDVKVDAVSEQTVRFELPDVYAPFAEATTMPLLPAHRLGGLTIAEVARHEFSRQPIGTGPFRFRGMDEERIVLDRNDSFYRNAPERGRPYLDRVVLRVYADSAAALQALARGEAHGFAGLLPAEADRVRRLRTTGVYALPSSEYTVLFFNLAPDHAILLDRRVRQAMALAVNRPRLMLIATGGHGAVADQPVPPTSWAYAKEARRYEYAPDEARELLESAGWVDADQDGVREKGQVALRLTLVASDDPARLSVAEQIARDLLAVGIEATVEAVPFATLVETRARERAYDALLISINAGTDPDPYAFWHSSQVKPPGHNFTGYATLGSDRALEAARRTLDQAKRGALYAQVFAQVAEDVPALYLYFSDFMYAIDRSVRGLRIPLITDPSQRFWNVEDWYVRTAVEE